MAFSLSTLTKAQLVFTAGGAIANTETISIGGKQYTFLDTVGTTDGNVHIGASDDLTMDNLVAAINNNLADGETGVAGTDYAVATVINPHCVAVKGASTIFTAIAKVGGTVGDLIVVAEANGGSWAGAATQLAGGAGSAAVALQEINAAIAVLESQFQLNSSVILRLDEISDAIDPVD